MPLINRKKRKTQVEYRVVTCPNCGARIELKTRVRRYRLVALLLLAVIAAAMVYFNRDIATLVSTRLDSSRPQGEEVMEKKDALEKAEAEAEVQAEAEAHEKAQAEAAAQAEAEASTAKAETQRSEVEQAKRAIQQKINRNWTRPSSTIAGSHCTIRVRLMSDGTVMITEIVSSSGDDDFDQSAEEAVNKASPLPVPKDKALFAREFRSFQFMFNPKQ
jgi:colicin import membrane protein